MQDEWVRMGLLVGVAVVMFLILKAPKKRRPDRGEEKAENEEK